jgi:anti-sigma regulatory factor (Ser/Thr protein kinase)
MSSNDAVHLALSVPPDPEQISTIRSFAFAVGRHEGLDDEAIEDLKLALSEIAADEIERGADTPIVVTVRLDDLVEFSIEASGARAARPQDRIDRRQIVGALFPSVRIADTPSGVRTTFSVARG